VHAFVAHDHNTRAHVAGDACQEDDAVDGHERHRLGRVAVSSAKTLFQKRVNVQHRRRRVDARRRRGVWIVRAG